MDLAVPTLVNHAASRPTSLEDLHGFILQGLMCNLSKSALDRSWGLLGFLLCLRAREPTTPEPASTEGVWHIRGWACIFRWGQENRRKKFGKRPRFWSEKRRDFGAGLLEPFSPRPKSSTPIFPPVPKAPRQIPIHPVTKIHAKFLHLLLVISPSVPPWFCVAEFGKQYAFLYRYNNSNTRFMTPRTLEPLNHGMAVMHTCNDAMHVALSKGGEINMSVLSNSRHNPERNTSMNRILLGFFAQNSLCACAILNMSLFQCTLLRRRTASKHFPNKVM